MTGADLLNTASVSYRDPAGNLRTGISNTVAVAVSTTVDLPDPDLSGLDGKTFSSRDTITLDYKGNANLFNWEFSLSDNPISAVEQAASFSGSAGHVFPASTSAPRLSLSSLSLPTGRYTLRIQAISGSSASGWSSANISIVSADLSAAHVFPNPWRAARGDGSITFDQMPANSTVKIFTVSGRWIRTLSARGGTVSWDLSNDAGDKVASGLYLYLLTDIQGNTARGKLAVIR